jgi:hypothetical protein
VGMELHGLCGLVGALELQDEGMSSQFGSLDHPHVKHGLEVAFLAVGVAQGRLVEANELSGGRVTLKRLKTGLELNGYSSLSLPRSDSGFFRILFFFML